MAQESKVPPTTLSMDDFSITSVSGRIGPDVETRAAALAAGAPSPLGPLAALRGTWKGTGFNQIWRPFHGSQDRFLELNETTEVLQFIAIPGDIPNRGLLQTDIELHGLTYLQKINDANVKQGGKPAGIHIEPGIWVSVPATTNPLDPPTVSRLANIPHGTSLVAQGSAFSSVGAPVIGPASIVPFLIAPPNTPINFPEQNLGIPSTFRTPPGDIPHVTQAIVNNPNLVLNNGLVGKTINSVTTLVISTQPLNPPSSGGGTSNIAFLDGSAGGPNAQAAKMTATFWIEEFVDDDGDTHHQLQYTQTVLLNFNGLSWPHVSVANLIKQ
jgi:prepilin-type processing-associated H-X9-DG protein